MVIQRDRKRDGSNSVLMVLVKEILERLGLGLS